MAWLAAALCGAVLLSGCATDAPTVVPVDIAPLSAQIGILAQANADLRAANERLAQANADLRAANERLKSMLRADADAGLAANAKGWLPFEGYVFRQQIARLPGVQPDASTAAKWTEAAGLYAAGGASAMQGVIESLHTDATTQAAKLGEIEARLAQLTKERDAAQASASRSLETVQAAKDTLAAAVEKARQDEARAIRAEQVRRANSLGTWCAIAALIFAAGAVLVSGVRDRFIALVLLAGGSSATFFAYARWLGSPWFERVVIGAWALSGVVGLIWLIRRGIAEREAKAKADRDGLVAAVLVQKLNDFYDSADADMKAKLNAGIFAELEEAGPAYAAAVKRIKADNIEAAATLSTTSQP